MRKIAVCFAMLFLIGAVLCLMAFSNNASPQQDKQEVEKRIKELEASRAASEKRMVEIEAERQDLVKKLKELEGIGKDWKESYLRLREDVRKIKLAILTSWYQCADSGFQEKVGYPYEGHFAFLGIGFEYLSKETSESFGLSEWQGIKVKTVALDSPAQKAGLQEGDVILRVNGSPVKSAGLYGKRHVGKDEYEARVMTTNFSVSILPGETAEFEYVRKGEKKMVSITLTCRTDGEECLFWNSSGMK